MATTTTTVQAKATVRYLPVSASKVRPVLGLIRGLPVEDAERALQLCPRGAADDVFKLLESAIANAEHTRQIPPDELFVDACWADEGPTRRWGRPRARGRYARIRKRSCHITITLSRFAPDELEERREREEQRGGTVAEARRRRAERVASSKAAKAEAKAEAKAAAEAEAHEHDHEHDHDEPRAEDAVDETAAIVEDVEADEVETAEAESEALDADAVESTEADEADEEEEKS